MSNKILYQQFCEQENEIPVFSRPWYLDAVCQTASENWDVILLEENGKIIASWPYMIREKFGFRFNLSPKLTKFLGPYIVSRKRSQKQMHKICATLIAKLPSSKIFQQNFHYNFTDWLPFYWEGFEQSTRYSYILNNLENLDQVYQNFSSDYRNNKIKKAESTIKVVDDLDTQTFFEVAMMSFQRQKLPLPFD